MANTYIPLNPNMTTADAETIADAYLSNLVVFSRDDWSDAYWKVLKSLREYESKVINLNLAALFGTI